MEAIAEEPDLFLLVGFVSLYVFPLNLDYNTFLLFVVIARLFVTAFAIQAFWQKFGPAVSWGIVVQPVDSMHVYRSQETGTIAPGTTLAAGTCYSPRRAPRNRT